jgi:hypothetical protein
LVGAVNSSPPRDRVEHFLGSGPASGMSRQGSLRRIYLANTRDNAADFERVDFREEDADEMRPRSSHDGSWPGDPNQITIIGGGAGYGANPNPATPSRTITLNAGTPPAGHVFSGWTAVTPPDLNITNSNLSTGATFVMIDSPVTVRANFIEMNMPAPGIIINQIYGQGSAGENAVSHGFIELYNPTAAPVSLNGISVQLQNPGDPASETPPDWQVLPLPEFTMQPRTSYLITSTTWAQPEGHTPRHTIAQFDLAWNVEFGNRTMTVALVNGSEPLSPVIAASEWSRVRDLVGAINTGLPRDRADNFLIEPAVGISRQASVRRDNFLNERDNSTDFVRVHFGTITDEQFDELRPRWSGNGAWPSGNPITVSGGTASLNNAEAGTIITVTAGTPPSNQRFVNWTASPAVTFQNAHDAVTTFTMPANAVTITANWEAIPVGQDIVLTEIIRTENNAAAENNQFAATGGLYQNVSNLTAWSDGVQVPLGFTGSNRVPVVLNNLAEPNGWRSVNPNVAATHIDHGISINEATAFQIKFETTGHENIRFSARQRSTGSGPDFFALAYRIGSTGDWIAIPGTRNTESLQNTSGFRTDTYADYNWQHSQTFDGVLLPVAVDNRAEVYLRVYMLESEIANTEAARRNGNTSINDILIIGDGLGTGADIFDINVTGGNATASHARATANTTITLNAGATPVGYFFDGWTAPGVNIQNAANPTGATFIMPASNVTVTANFVPLVLAPESLIIHQIYGQGSQGENAVSHGFVEIFNPTNAPVNINGWSLQIQNIADGAAVNVHPADWNVIPLSGTIQPNNSYLVVSSTWANPDARYVIENWDAITTTVEFSNRNMSVAIVNNTTPLSPLITPAQMLSVVDLTGAVNNADGVRDRVHNFLVASALRISRSEAARRIWNDGEVQNTRDNRADFVGVRYAADGISLEEIQELRPRWSGDGAWSIVTGDLYSVTVDGGTASRTQAAEGTIINLTAENRAGYIFTGWSGVIVTPDFEPMSITSPPVVGFRFINFTRRD